MAKYVKKHFVDAMQFTHRLKHDVIRWAHNFQPNLIADWNEYGYPIIKIPTIYQDHYNIVNIGDYIVVETDFVSGKKILQVLDVISFKQQYNPVEETITIAQHIKKEPYIYPEPAKINSNARFGRFLRCAKCKRKVYDLSRIDNKCNMPQRGGSRCSGTVVYST